jgi:tetratricopeptide (TPR) repeat protein
MSTPTTPSTPPAGDDRNLVQVAPAPATPGFEERLQTFWSKNAKTIMLACVVVLLAIVAKGAMEWMAASKERGIAADYAAATTNDQLKAFANAQPGHALAGAAHLRLADDAFGSGDYTAALADYQKSAEILKTGPLAGRARLGAAMAKFHSNDTAGAQADLRAIADDVTQLKAVRAEAAYHLASLASEAGNTAEVARLADQVMTIDPTSLWSQRAMMLRASAPAAVAASAPAASETPAAESGDALPAIQFKTGN